MNFPRFVRLTIATIILLTTITTAHIYNDLTDNHAPSLTGTTDHDSYDLNDHPPEYSTYFSPLQPTADNQSSFSALSQPHIAFLPTCTVRTKITQCYPYNGTYCKQFFNPENKNDFFVGLEAGVTIAQMEAQLLIQAHRILSADRYRQCDLRVLANLCIRTYQPCRLETQSQTEKLVRVPYCDDTCRNAACDAPNAGLPEPSTCCPGGGPDSIPLAEGYVCFDTFKPFFTSIATVDAEAILAPLQLTCPSPMVEASVGNEIEGFQGGRCSAPCPSVFVDRSVYSTQDGIVITLNILSLLSLVFLTASVLMFRAKFIKQVYPLFYFACVIAITLSLSAVIVIAWARGDHLSKSLCESNIKEYHMSGYPAVQSVICIFGFMASAAWSLVCIFEACAMVWQFETRPKYAFFLKCKNWGYHAFAWGLALYSVVGPFLYNQVGATPIGGTFAWIGPSRQQYAKIQLDILRSAEQSSEVDTLHHSTIYDVGNTFFYIPLWIVLSLTTFCALFTALRLVMYRFRMVSSQKTNNTNNTAMIARVVIFALVNVFIAVVFGIYKIFVVDRRSLIDRDDNQFFACLTGSVVVWDSPEGYAYCRRTSSLNYNVVLLLSACINSLGVIAFLAYGTQSKIWKAWAGWCSKRFGANLLASYENDYENMIQPSTRTPAPNKPQLTADGGDGESNHNDPNDAVELTMMSSQHIYVRAGGSTRDTLTNTNNPTIITTASTPGILPNPGTTPTLFPSSNNNLNHPKFLMTIPSTTLGPALSTPSHASTSVPHAIRQPDPVLCTHPHHGKHNCHAPASPQTCREPLNSDEDSNGDISSSTHTTFNEHIVGTPSICLDCRYYDKVELRNNTHKKTRNKILLRDSLHFSQIPSDTGSDMSPNGHGDPDSNIPPMFQSRSNSTHSARSTAARLQPSISTMVSLQTPSHATGSENFNIALGDTTIPDGSIPISVTGVDTTTSGSHGSMDSSTDPTQYQPVPFSPIIVVQPIGPITSITTIDEFNCSFTPKFPTQYPNNPAPHSNQSKHDHIKDSTVLLNRLHGTISESSSIESISTASDYSD